VIDPGAPEPVAAFLQAHALTVDFLFNTHGHADHAGGTLALQKRFGGTLVGSAFPAPGMTRALKDGDLIPFGRNAFKALATPGHTRDSFCYYLGGRPGRLFSGDTLFIGGCGRLLDGTPRELWLSLKKLAALPDDTEIYPGHEYTLENYAFCLEQEPDNPVLSRQAELAREKIKQGKPTPPSTLGVEKQTNPFLRAGSAESLALQRERKNSF
jgi:hydroxyacylglutathione hydrolase